MSPHTNAGRNRCGWGGTSGTFLSMSVQTGSMRLPSARAVMGCSGLTLPRRKFGAAATAHTKWMRRGSARHRSSCAPRTSRRWVLRPAIAILKSDSTRDRTRSDMGSMSFMRSVRHTSEIVRVRLAHRATLTDAFSRSKKALHNTTGAVLGMAHR